MVGIVGYEDDRYVSLMCGTIMHNTSSRVGVGPSSSCMLVGGMAVPMYDLGGRLGAGGCLHYKLHSWNEEIQSYASKTGYDLG